MGEEEQTLSLVMEEREPARSEEAEAEEPYAEVTGETGVVEGVVVEEAPLTNWMLEDCVKRWCAGDREGLPPISTWNTSRVTVMSWLFHGESKFNDDISAWSTSSVTTMEGMFYNASAFNQPLNGWRVDNVTDMHAMFYYASAFNQPLNDWRVDNVTEMRWMFRDASSFNQPLHTWRLRKRCNVSNMFDDDFQNSGPVIIIKEASPCCSIS